MSRIVLALCILLLAVPAAAGDDLPFELILQGGLSQPRGEHSLLDTGAFGSAALLYGLSEATWVGVESGVQLFSWSGEVPGFRPYGIFEDVDGVVVELHAVAKRHLLSAGRHRFYGKAQGGMTWSQVRSGAALDETTASVTDPGLAVGGGWQLLGEKESSIFLEALYHVAFTAGDRDANYLTVGFGAGFFLH